MSRVRFTLFPRNHVVLLLKTGFDMQTQRGDLMASNVEVKTRLRNPGYALATARTLADQPEERLLQTDTFFHWPRGRLKLRDFGGRGELIYYERADDPSIRESRYFRLRIAFPELVRRVLALLVGVRSSLGSSE